MYSKSDKSVLEVYKQFNICNTPFDYVYLCNSGNNRSLEHLLMYNRLIVCFRPWKHSERVFATMAGHKRLVSRQPTPLRIVIFEI